MNEIIKAKLKRMALELQELAENVGAQDLPDECYGRQGLRYDLLHCRKIVETVGRRLGVKKKQAEGPLS